MIIMRQPNNYISTSTQYASLACTFFTLSDLAFKYNVNDPVLFSKKLLSEHLQKNSNGSCLHSRSIDLKESLHYLNFIYFTTVGENVINGSSKQQLKQYLRKFKFYYKVFCLNSYPNNFSSLSNRNLNKLALKNLLVFSGL